MARIEFIKRILRLGLLAMIALIVFLLGNRIVTGQDCTACPGKGICRGVTDCDKY
jgi:hypothetical protein